MKNSDQFYKRRQKIKICLQVTCVFSVTDSQNRHKFNVRAWTRKKNNSAIFQKTFKNSLSKIHLKWDTSSKWSSLYCPAKFEMTIGKTYFRGEPWESMKNRKIFDKFSNKIFCPGFFANLYQHH